LRLCIVVPCYNEEEVLPALIAELKRAMAASRVSVRVLLVDDGSVDGTAHLLLRECDADRRFAYLRLSRNFGHQAAVTAGLRHARGDLIGVIDADLQDPPAVLLAMVEKWREGFDVVYGIRRNRKEGLPARAAYSAYYRLLHRVADVEIPLDAGDFCLMDRRTADHLNALPERRRFVRGLRSWVGFRQTGFPYDRPERAAGRSRYGLAKLLHLGIDGLISFSWLPLRLAGVAGALSAIAACGYLLFALIARLVFHHTPPGWASLVSVFIFLGGIQLLVLWIMGEYLGRVFDEVKQRPSYVVDITAGWLSPIEPQGHE
jgi:glycosyltransferase involved in cell wall biosynthesis